MAEALAPFLLGAAFAYVLDPAVSRWEARGLRRSHLIAAGYLAALALGAAAYGSLKPMLARQTERLQAQAPAYLQHIERLAAAQGQALTRRLPLPRQTAERALDSVVASALERLQELPARLLGLLPLLAGALLVPFIGFFFLLDGPRGVEALIQLTPARRVEQALHLLSEVDAALGNYLRGILIVAGAIAAASFVGLFLMGLDDALFVAVIAGLSSFVPYLGAVLGALIGGALAVYQFGTLRAGLEVVLLFAGIRLADEALLQPVIARHSVRLHPLAFLLALVVGGELFGFLGLVFAVPAACILKALLTVGWSWYSTATGLAPASATSAAVPYT
ncbi:MAG: AI-2E family transporter [Elusimicrobia bacterium]|nr:AI-2E family transporter [Elusimicrobiota bacterium]